MCQISRHSEDVFVFYSNFCKCAKTRREKNEIKIETLAAYISEMAGAISFKFGM